MSAPVKVGVKRLPHGEGLPLPAYATDGAAGMDVVSAEEVTIAPGARHAVAVSNGTAALHLACLAAGVGAGDLGAALGGGQLHHRDEQDQQP